MLEMHKPINSPISESVEIVKNRMKPKCLSIWEWINKIWYSCAQIILYSTENKLAKFTQHLSSIFGWKKAPIKFAQALSRVQLFSTPWTVTHQTPPSMGFSKQEYWSGLPCPSPGDLPSLKFFFFFFFVSARWKHSHWRTNIVWG